MKKWSRKHGGFSRLLTTIGTITMAAGTTSYHWPGSFLSPLRFSHPPGFFKIILDVFCFLPVFQWTLVVFGIFDFFSIFGYFVKDVKDVFCAIRETSRDTWWSIFEAKLELPGIYFCSRRIYFALFSFISHKISHHSHHKYEKILSSQN